jgi:hypothetical protein
LVPSAAVLLLQQQAFAGGRGAAIAFRGGTASALQLAI